MTPLGPVSQSLEGDLRTWVQKHGVILWLDLDSNYSELVASLADARAKNELPYAVHSFRGSHLALMLELERLAGGVDKTAMVVHLPGFNEESIRETPILELYSAGVRYRKSLNTLVSEAAAGRVRPEQIAAFQEQGTLTLPGADAWLAALLDQGGQGGLGAQLRSLTPTAVLDDLLADGLLAGRLSNPPDLQTLWQQLGVWTGLPQEWRDAALPPGEVRARDVAFALASWALAVEYVDDLRRKPVDERLLHIPTLPRAVMDACCELARHLRARHPTVYRRTADETEGWLEAEVDKADADDLGQIDTFRFEEAEVLKKALEHLDSNRWSEVLHWSTARTTGASFWVQNDPSRLAAWQLVRDAATLGQALTEATPSLNATTLSQAVERYQSHGSRVDQAHRILEQRRTAVLYPQLPQFERLRASLDYMRDVWSSWADDWSRQFNALCDAQGFLPPAHLQQRTLFDEVVRPMAQEPGATAYFVVDAMRYEMALELLNAIDSTPATTAILRGRLAELPTVTEVGMNVLAPVSDQGRLYPAIENGKIKGFSTGQYRVRNPETRQRAMRHRVGGTTCPWLTLADVLGRDSSSLKQTVSKANLVIVHSLEIDNAGEKGVGTSVFDHVLQKLRAAWRLLREAGVRRFVMTADHGFLLLDESAHPAQSYGRKIDPKRRHVLTEVGADHDNESRVPLSSLNYEGVAGSHLIFPTSTAVFDTGKRTMSFVHGGNSLQERVIPVLTVLHRAAAGGDSLRYTIRGEALDEVAGMHCISVCLEVEAQGGLAFGGSGEIELVLRAVEEADVQVELCQVRGKARVSAGVVVAPVGETFELFFKLTGPSDARVDVQLVHLGGVAQVEDCTIDRRFAVTGSRRKAQPDSPQGVSSSGWLDSLPDGGVRQLFQHLTAHGAVTESEASDMLGGARQVRKFARKFEEYAAKAPFAIRIDVVAGVKRYVREGSAK